MKLFLFSGVLLVLMFLLPIKHDAWAAKKFVPKKTTSKARSYGTAIPVSVRYRPDKRAILFHFTNFANLTSANYIFSYTTNGIEQGAAGTITISNQPDKQRELLFGTCSAGVCTYHGNLKNTKLQFSVKLKNGRTASKIYRIKTYY